MRESEINDHVVQFEVSEREQYVAHIELAETEVSGAIVEERTQMRISEAAARQHAQFEVECMRNQLAHYKHQESEQVQLSMAAFELRASEQEMQKRDCQESEVAQLRETLRLGEHQLMQSESHRRALENRIQHPSRRGGNPTTRFQSVPEEHLLHGSDSDARGSSLYGTDGESQEAADRWMSHDTTPQDGKASHDPPHVGLTRTVTATVTRTRVQAEPPDRGDPPGGGEYGSGEDHPGGGGGKPPRDTSGRGGTGSGGWTPWRPTWRPRPWWR